MCVHLNEGKHSFDWEKNKVKHNYDAFLHTSVHHAFLVSLWKNSKITNQINRSDKQYSTNCMEMCKANHPPFKPADTYVLHTKYEPMLYYEFTVEKKAYRWTPTFQLWRIWKKKTHIYTHTHARSSTRRCIMNNPCGYDHTRLCRHAFVMIMVIRYATDTITSLRITK
jgi:hypothetical protein